MTSLSGRTILITRPASQAIELATMLKEEGAHPALFPLIEIAPQAEALARLAADANAADWLVFVSPSAIDCAWPTLAGLASNVRLATIGAASAAKLSAMLDGYRDVQQLLGTPGAAERTAKLIYSSL